jgi:hypothetical protein
LLRNPYRGGQGQFWAVEPYDDDDDDTIIKSNELPSSVDGNPPFIQRYLKYSNKRIPLIRGNEKQKYK